MIINSSSSFHGSQFSENCLFPWNQNKNKITLISCLTVIVYIILSFKVQGFPHSSISKEFACNAGDLGLIPGSGRSPGEGNGNPLQYSCLENPMDGGPVRHDLVTKERERISCLMAVVYIILTFKVQRCFIILTPLHLDYILFCFNKILIICLKSIIQLLNLVVESAICFCFFDQLVDAFVSDFLLYVFVYVCLCVGASQVLW